jgi:hypothetical protein
LIKKKKNSYQQKLHQKIHKHLETEQDVAAWPVGYWINKAGNQKVPGT